MWPFKPKPKAPCWKQQGVEAFKAFRDIGQTFNYLGRTCIVTRHWMLWPYVGPIPELHADYVDECGIVRSISFLLGELPGLKAQNPDVQG